MKYRYDHDSDSTDYCRQRLLVYLVNYGLHFALRSLQDKPTIVADNSPLSPNHGRVYVSWTVSTDDKPSSGLRVAYSDDYGKSWSNKKVLTTGANDLFAQLSIGKNGEVLISYSNLDDSSHHLLVSKDGALTFENRLISNFIPFPINTVGRPSLKGIYGFRAYPYPATRVDLSTNRLHAVYGSWKVWSSVDSSAELLYTFSDDLGQTWKSPIIVGESENISLIHRDHFFPWLAFDEFTHQTSLVYYSSEDDISNIKTTPYRLTIAGNGLSSASLIGDSMFNPLYESSPSLGVPAFIGDYIGCDVYKNRFASAWTQNRLNQNDGDVFAFIGTTDTLVSKVDDLPMKVNSDRLWLSNVFPNPTKERYAVVNFTIPVSGNVGLDIFSMSGVLIKNIFKRNILAGSYSQEIDLRSIASGYYEVRLSTQLNILERQLIISH